MTQHLLNILVERDVIHSQLTTVKVFLICLELCIYADTKADWLVTFERSLGVSDVQYWSYPSRSVWTP